MAKRSKEMEIAIKIAGKVENSFKSALNAATKGLGRITKAVGAATAAAAAAVAAIGVAAVKVGMEFDSAMSQVAGTMLLDKQTEEGQKAFATLENAARECGRSTAFSATEAAEALNYLALAGYSAQEAADALPVVLRLAGAGAMELAQASDMLTDSMSALGIEATQDNLTEFADKMAKTASKSNTSVAQLGEAILAVGGTASNLKGKTTELNASLGILADSGIKAAEGGTHLRNMILVLQKARNSDAANLFEKMGLDAYDAEGKMRSLGDIFLDLNNALKGASAQEVDSVLATIFKQTDLAAARAMMAATVDSVDGLRTVMDASLADAGTSVSDLGINIEDMVKNFDVLTTQEEFAAKMLDQFGLTGEQAGTLFTGLQSILNGTGNRFLELSAEIENSAGACEKMYKILLDNLGGDLDILKSALSDVGISISNAITTPLRGMVQFATSTITDLGAAFDAGGMEGMVHAIGDCLARSVQAVGVYIPQFVQMGVTLIQSFIDGITSNSGNMASVASQIIITFVNGLITLVPQIILAGADIAIQFIESMLTQLPALIQGGTSAISTFISGVISRIPEIKRVAGQIIAHLISGIQNDLPRLIPIAMNALVNFSGRLRENAGKLVDVGLKLIMTLAESLINNIPVFIETIPTIITNIAGIINDNAPKILMCGITLIGKLAVGLIQAIPVLIANIPKIIQAVVSVITAFNWMALGSRIIYFITHGMKNLALSIPDTLRRIGKQANVWLHTINWRGTGAKIIQAVWAGIKGLGHTIPAGLKAIGQTALNIFKSINWRTVGTQIITAIWNGIKAVAHAIPSALKAIGKAAFNFIKSIDWIDVGITIIKGIIAGLTGALDGLWGVVSDIGKGIVNKVKGFFGGKEETQTVKVNTEIHTSYIAGIENSSALTDGVASLSNIFNHVDTSKAAEAGAEAGEVFQTELTNSLFGDMDDSLFTDNMAEMGVNGAAALSDSFSESLGNMEIDETLFTESFASIGNDGAMALGGGMTDNGQAVISAAQSLGTEINAELDSGWNKAIMSAQNAMQRLSTTVTTAAKTAAQTIKSAFETMTITIPKPKLPVIEVKNNPVTYGEGANINVPKFSVHWNALGGIFDQPTILSTAAGFQGVGEKGPEAILPLNTLWKQMRDILTDILKGNPNSVESYTERLERITPQHASSGNLAGVGGITITYSPVQNFYGTTKKEDIIEAEKISQAEFAKMLKQFFKDNARTNWRG